MWRAVRLLGKLTGQSGRVSQFRFSNITDLLCSLFWRDKMKSCYCWILASSIPWQEGSQCRAIREVVYSCELWSSCGDSDHTEEKYPGLFFPPILWSLLSASHWVDTSENWPPGSAQAGWRRVRNRLRETQIQDWHSSFLFGTLFLRPICNSYKHTLLCLT
jgi:transposase